MKKTALFMIHCYLLLGGAMAIEARASEISGKVFISTGMGGTEDLNPAEISALPEGNPEVARYFKAKHRYSEEQRQMHAATLASRQRELSDTLAGGPPDPKAMEAVNKGYKEAFESLKSWTGPAYYFQELPGHLIAAKAKTGADGKFSMTVPAGKYVIAATASRAGNTGQGAYYWLVKIDATTGDQSVMLDNDNLFETNCAACVQPARLTEK